MTYNAQDRNNSLPATPERPQPTWMPGVLELLRASYASNPSVQQIAERARVHPVHLCRSFRKHHGVTLGQYMRRLKVEHARLLLANSDVTLSEIASRCGFCDQSHFSSVFKRIAGVTPGEYRFTARSSSGLSPAV
jgi:transcriptional regulator GlxA family with amidase domain